MGLNIQQPSSSEHPKAIWDFGRLQSEDYALRLKENEALARIGSPSFARDHVTVQNVTGIVPQLQDSPYLRVPPPISYALFGFPPHWKLQFRKLFSPQGIISSFGTARDVELAIAKIQSTQVADQSQQRQKTALMGFFDVYSDLCDMLHEIRGRMGQFVGA